MHRYNNDASRSCFHYRPGIFIFSNSSNSETMYDMFEYNIKQDPLLVSVEFLDIRSTTFNRITTSSIFLKSRSFFTTW